ncbi:MAG: class I SAM-dependent methyltransferase [Steroidobacteraceae bacterium]
MSSSCERFTSRADAYARHRPGYPAAAVTLLQQRCGLSAQAVVADIGSGTGILTALLLASGARVFGVEPNGAMRAVAETALAGAPRFRSVNGTAEDTTLAAGSVDLLVAGQAFHWFDAPKARREALRVIRAGGRGALLWNERPREATAFLADYEAMLRRHAPQYAAITASRADEASMRGFFGGAMERATFANQQELDFEGLRGRLMSSTYAPEPQDPGYAPIIAALRQVFDTHARAGRVVLPYQTLVYFGPLR